MARDAIVKCSALKKELLPFGDATKASSCSLFMLYQERAETRVLFTRNRRTKTEVDNLNVSNKKRLFSFRLLNFLLRCVLMNRAQHLSSVMAP
jgi:hypothetical protein